MLNRILRRRSRVVRGTWLCPACRMDVVVVITGGGDEAGEMARTLDAIRDAHRCAG